MTYDHHWSWQLFQEYHADFLTHSVQQIKAVMIRLVKSPPGGMELDGAECKAKEPTVSRGKKEKKITLGTRALK